MRLGRLVAAAAALLAVAPSYAQGATVSLTDWKVSFEAAPGEANRVTVARTPESVRVSDEGAPLVAGPGCALVGGRVECPSELVASVALRLGDGDDVVEMHTATPTTVAGGEGNDRLSGGEEVDLLDGGPGDDVLKSGIGDDRLVGGPGADVFAGGTGSELGPSFGEGGGGLHVAGCEVEYDVVSPRDDLGTDVVSYAARSDPVAVTVDGVANDGAPGEGDNVLPDVEWVLGGRASDRFVGDGRRNYFTGFGGDDVFVGGGGNDLFLAGRGDDRFTGGAGNDCAAGGGGEDRLDAGSGADLLLGGLDFDRLSAGDGDDAIVSRDGAPDVVTGGRGYDIGVVDVRRDRVRGVERAFARPPVEAPPGVGELTGRG